MCLWPYSSLLLLHITTKTILPQMTPLEGHGRLYGHVFSKWFTDVSPRAARLNGLGEDRDNANEDKDNHQG